MRSALAAFCFVLIVVSESPAFGDACDDDRAASRITSIRIHREGGCLGYYTPPDAPAGKPFYLTGRCAEYTLTLRSDGSAEYIGRIHVPLLGPYRGAVTGDAVRRIARLVEEIGFEEWETEVAPQKTVDGWLCVSMDGVIRSAG